MEKIVKFTKDTFSSYKVTLRYECCKDKSQKCSERFNELKLEILNNNKSNSNYSFTQSHYNLYNNTIEVTVLKLAKEYTEKGIERILLHEMGHICHVASVSEGSTAEFDRFAQNETKCSKEVGAEFLYNFDKKIQSCLIKNLESQIEKKS